jgi:hypothetical protein
MDEMWTHIAEGLADRVSGPLKFRFVLQPLMAAFFAVRAGLADARAGHPPYFWGLLTDRGERAAMIKDGWHSVGKVVVLAVVFDAVYQLIVSHVVYPGEAVLVASLLALVPYLVLRGLVTRLARRKDLHHDAPGTWIRS